MDAQSIIVTIIHYYHHHHHHYRQYCTVHQTTRFVLPSAYNTLCLLTTTYCMYTVYRTANPTGHILQYCTVEYCTVLYCPLTRHHLQAGLCRPYRRTRICRVSWCLCLCVPIARAVISGVQYVHTKKRRGGEEGQSK